MDMLIAFCQKLRLGKLLAVFAAGFVLILNVACSNGTVAGARPNNPSVQMGGQNNPHKAGGDGYSEYQMSTDPAVSKRDRASAFNPDQLVATASETVDRSASKLERSASKLKARLTDTTQIRGNAMRDAMEEAQQIPEKPQEVIDRSDPNAKILEKSIQTFKEASKHLTGSTDQSIE